MLTLEMHHANDFLPGFQHSSQGDVLDRRAQLNPYEIYPHMLSAKPPSDCISVIPLEHYGMRYQLSSEIIGGN